MTLEYKDGKDASFNKRMCSFHVSVCTVVLGLAEQLSVIHNETVTKGLERLCKFLPEPYQGACKEFADFIAADIIRT